MIIQYNISLKPYNTFGIEATAAEFVEINSTEELQVLCQTFNLKERNLLILGGGSNLLLTKNFDGMVVKINMKGIEILHQTNTYVLLKCMAGEVWHHLVMYCIERDFGGIENLSLIPGCVGAAPMQNIGAYGVELKDVFFSLEAIEIDTCIMKTFDAETCKFGYRESIFKNKLKGKYIITSVILKLTSKNHKINTSYGAIHQVLQCKNIINPTIKDVSDAVINIRTSKLPDPKLLGNSGSFFKNPEVEEKFFNQLKQTYPNIVGYSTGENKIKVAAGWLIEQCGWKGKIVGNTGSHKDQALVLVNYGKATGEEIYMLAMAIQASVKEKFGITIEPEVNII
ncbi:MAG: UDP-N-acetylmuramate dehydrogenase [Bacteroidia bacterium]